MIDKIKNGNFSDDRIRKLYEMTYNLVKDKAREMQIPAGNVIGVLENVKHELQHEFLTIDHDMIEY
jgi:hypothetical protein